LWLIAGSGGFFQHRWHFFLIFISEINKNCLDAWPPALNKYLRARWFKMSLTLCVEGKLSLSFLQTDRASSPLVNPDLAEAEAGEARERLAVGHNNIWLPSAGVRRSNHDDNTEIDSYEEQTFAELKEGRMEGACMRAFQCTIRVCVRTSENTLCYVRRCILNHYCSVLDLTVPDPRLYIHTHTHTQTLEYLPCARSASFH
jgi:hypothetical protein